MIDHETADDVRAMLAGGISRYETARRIGVSRQTVDKIARGEWHPRRVARGGQEQQQQNGQPQYREVRPYRCPGCRQRVYLDPCPLCWVRGR